MKKFLFFFLFSFLFIAGENFKNIKISENERVIIFAPHPDDEILGCSGLISSILEKNGNIWVVYLTNGDHNQLVFKLYEKKPILNPSDYIKLGEIRRKESIKATEILGVKKENLIFLGYPDFGTLKIWKEFWNTKKPYKSFLTRASSVPYKENYSFGKPYIGESIVSDIEKIIKEINPTKIFVTPSFDLNVDHRALYNFVNLAILNISEANQPEIYCYLIHFKNWPVPSKYKPEKNLFPPNILKFLDWYILNLDDEKIAKKYESLNCFKSQIVVRKNWFFSFVRKNEIFYKFYYEILKNGQEIKFESEKEEFENNKKQSIPFLIGLKKDKDEISIILSHEKKAVEKVDYIFYIYPWKKKINFEIMPKITLKLGKEKGILIDKTLSKKYKINLNKEMDGLNLKIDMKELGNPDYIFFSSEILINDVIHDFIPWGVIKIEKD
jgi:N-acetyl-1-D-myo-inositol-2-amino-2-deoxy-alpha-D-glucopyranoside deacetylase